MAYLRIHDKYNWYTCWIAKFRIKRIGWLVVPYIILEPKWQNNGL